MTIFASDQWNLKQEFLISQMDRIDNPNYFSSGFICPDIDNFISEIRTSQDAIVNRSILNLFFDRMIASNSNNKTVYVRMKWLVYFHKLIQLFGKKSVMFKLATRALQRYTEKADKIFKGIPPYENYLVKTLIKPYMQYLLKLSMLDMPLKEQQETSKNQNNIKCYANINSINSVDHRKVMLNLQTQSEQEDNEGDLLKWYRSYNFILSTLETFEKKLKEFEPFFSSELPFLCNIRYFIAKDLQKKFHSLKNTKISLHDLNMTMIQLDRIENRISVLSRRTDKNIFDDELFNEIQDYTKEDIQNFMGSHLKIREKSLQSTLSFFEDE